MFSDASFCQHVKRILTLSAMSLMDSSPEEDNLLIAKNAEMRTSSSAEDQRFKQACGQKAIYSKPLEAGRMLHLP